MTCIQSISRSGIQFARVGAVAMAVVLTVACSSAPVVSPKRNFSSAALIGAHHMTSNFNIMEFFVNDHSGSNVGREGEGGHVCCVMLPWEWRPDLTVEVRWVVGDWSKEVLSEFEKGNYSSIAVEGIYIAQVPVEPYEESGSLYVHFFEGGKVRMVTSDTGPANPRHPILRNDPNAISKATQGRRIPQIYTAAENEELRKKYQGGK